MSLKTNADVTKPMKPGIIEETATDAARRRMPTDPWKAFPYFVGKCAEGFARELIEQGKTATQARNTVIGCFLDMAAGEACRVARGEGREPDRSKWDKAVNDAFERAVKRTAPKPCS